MFIQSEQIEIKFLGLKLKIYEHFCKLLAISLYASPTILRNFLKICSIIRGFCKVSVKCWYAIELKSIIAYNDLLCWYYNFVKFHEN